MLRKKNVHPIIWKLFCLIFFLYLSEFIYFANYVNLNEYLSLMLFLDAIEYNFVNANQFGSIKWIKNKNEKQILFERKIMKMKIKTKYTHYYSHVHSSTADLFIIIAINDMLMFNTHTHTKYLINSKEFKYLFLHKFIFKKKSWTHISTDIRINYLFVSLV